MAKVEHRYLHALGTMDGKDVRVAIISALHPDTRNVVAAVTWVEVARDKHMPDQWRTRGGEHQAKIYEGKGLSVAQAFDKAKKWVRTIGFKGKLKEISGGPYGTPARNPSTYAEDPPKTQRHFDEWAKHELTEAAVFAELGLCCESGLKREAYEQAVAHLEIVLKAARTRGFKLKAYSVGQVEHVHEVLRGLEPEVVRSRKQLEKRIAAIRKRGAKRNPCSTRDAQPNRARIVIPRKKSSQTWQQYHDQLVDLAIEARDTMDEVTANALLRRAGHIANVRKKVRTAPRGKGAKGPGSYPWNQCMSDARKRYGSDERARRVCGSIRAKSKRDYPAYWKERDPGRRLPKPNPSGRAAPQGSSGGGEQGFVRYLESTLIPDLRESGLDATADDFDTLVDMIREAEHARSRPHPQHIYAHGWKRKAFITFLRRTLIPDLLESGSRYTAADFIDGLLYLDVVLTKKEVRERVKTEGLVAKWKAATQEWRVAFPGKGQEAGAYYTPDGEDAVWTAVSMASDETPVVKNPKRWDQISKRWHGTDPKLDTRMRKDFEELMSDAGNIDPSDRAGYRAWAVKEIEGRYGMGQEPD